MAIIHTRPLLTSAAVMLAATGAPAHHAGVGVPRFAAAPRGAAPPPLLHERGPINPNRLDSSPERQKVGRAATAAVGARRARPPLLRAGQQRDFSLTDEDGQRLVVSAIIVGGLTGVVVAAFKSSIALVVASCYSGDAVVQAWSDRRLGDASVLIPAAGGLAVAALRLTSPRGKIGPGLAEHVAEVERSVPLRPEAAMR